MILVKECIYCGFKISENAKYCIYCGNMGKNPQSAQYQTYTASQNNTYYLFFDTETTGLPKRRNAPVTDIHNWPRLVQIAWMFCDEYGRNINSECHIVKPDGFVIPFDAQNIHGISNEKAHKEGKDLRYVLDRFSDAISRSSYLIAHNMEYDYSVVGSEFIRNRMNNKLDQINKICTMKSTTNYCKIPNNYGYKWPSLIELHYTLFNQVFQERHNADYDVSMCAKCFFELKRRGVL